MLIQFLHMAPRSGPILMASSLNRLPTLPPEYSNAFPPALREILRVFADTEKAALNMTVICRAELLTVLPETCAHPSNAHIAQFISDTQRSGKKAFVSDEEGTRVLVFGENRAVDLGGYRASMYESLAQKDRFPVRTAAHTDAIIELLQPEQGMLVCETGAGLDETRIARMNEVITDRHGHFLCHDVIPAVAKIGRERFPHVPYVALPPHPDYLGKALASFKGRKALTMKNTLSILKPSLIDVLFATAQAGNVDTIVTSQSIAQPLSLLVTKGDTTTIEVIERLTEHEVRQLVDDVRTANALQAIISIRARILFQAAFAELIHKHFLNKATRQGFCHHGYYTSEAQTKLRGQEAFEFTHTKLSHAFAREFMQGHFNAIIFSPSGISYQKKAGLEKDELEITTVQTHCVASRKQRESTDQHFSLPPAGLPLPAYIAYKEVTGDHTPASFDFSPEYGKLFEELSIRIALQTLFNFWGRREKLDPIAQYIGTNVETEIVGQFSSLA